MSPAITIGVETPDGWRELRAAPAEPAPTLTEILERGGFPLNTRCGRRGLCSGCEIELRKGSLLRSGDGGRIEAGGGVRVKSCQARLAGESVELFVPPRSLLRHEPAIVSDFRVNVPWAQNPLFPSAPFGLAVDVGTTTVALMLCDLATGRVAAQASAFNAQIRFGEDVVTRIQLCSTAPEGVPRLQRALVAETLNPLIREACGEAGVDPREIGGMVVAANTTMLHLLAGVNPRSMGVYPFSPVFLEHRTLAARRLGLEFGGDGAEIHLLPGPAAYVGADLAAGIVATGLLYDEGPAVLVDAGTNGEIIAKVGDRLVGCATAAGPAFEGAGLLSGTRAVRGAIERVRLRAEPFEAELGIIGGGAVPLGICGSAYIDFLGEARRAGILRPAGRFTDAFCAQADGAIEAGELGRKLRLHPAEASGGIWISEPDIARLLQAKAAIAAGIETLLGVLGVSAADVKILHLAGGFGMHLSIGHAVGCGLLPGFSPQQVQVVGNTSLGGAYLALNDRSLLEEMIAASEKMESIELNMQPGFEDSYVSNLLLP